METPNRARAALAERYDQKFQEFSRQFLDKNPLDRAQSLCALIATEAVAAETYSAKDIEEYLNWAVLTYLTNVTLDAASYQQLYAQVPSIVQAQILK